MPTCLARFMCSSNAARMFAARLLMSELDVPPFSATADEVSAACSSAEWIAAAVSSLAGFMNWAHLGTHLRMLA